MGEGEGGRIARSRIQNDERGRRVEGLGGRKRRRGCVGGYDGTPTQAPPFSSSLSSLPRALPVYPPRYR